ncbi:hypothetical protein C8J57DRAFT_1240118 [Mycena rebaudengoi]|nr:hypothetical protein C8J57DRAFT_1240118 [Mycena rebaudengoi]
MVVCHVEVRAVRRARRAGSTGSVRRVADPFRRAPEIFFDGTATGRFERVTAVTATGRHDGKTVLEVGLAGNQRRQSGRESPSSAHLSHQRILDAFNTFRP